MKLTKSMRRWLRSLPCKPREIPCEELGKLLGTGLAYLSVRDEHETTVELTPAGQRWLAGNPDEKDAKERK